MAMTQPLREQLKKGWMQECSTDELCSFSQEKTAKGGGESDEIEVQNSTSSTIEKRL
jgi:hypothetical protein